MAEVRLQEGEALENALRRFNCQGPQGEIMKELLRHSFSLKSGEERAMIALARKRSRKELVRSKADNRWVAP